MSLGSNGRVPGSMTAMTRAAVADPVGGQTGCLGRGGGGEEGLVRLCRVQYTWRVDTVGCHPS